MNINAYRVATYLGWPFILAYLARRKMKGKEDLNRFGERLGISKLQRPNGKLVWMHGASVGETVSMLSLIDKILDAYPDISVLVTSGTVTSAKVMQQRLPKRCFHQYVPVDCVSYTKKFIDHWQPDLALWFESDFWPNLLQSAKDKNIPLLLINGRISNRSFSRWKKFPSFMRKLQNFFSLSLGQTNLDAERLKYLGAINVDCVGNLKYATPPLPADNKVVEALKKDIGNRPCWIGASTHKSEEIEIARAHLKIKKEFPSILTIIVPRHPNRGEDISREIRNLGLEVSLRSKQEHIEEGTDIYIADTIGEMGIFYRLSPIVFIGGSIVSHGGQNFLEPARLDSAIIVGPHMENFSEMTSKALQANAIKQINKSKELSEEVVFLLKNPEFISERCEKAMEFASNEVKVLERVFDKIKPWLDK